MSFRDEYKKELGLISPDSEKIIEEVHERLNENAPIKIRIERRKKSAFVYIGSFAGAAACMALFVTVLFVVAPNFVKNDGSALSEEINRQEMMGGMVNPAAPGETYHSDDEADEAHRNESNKPNLGFWDASEGVLSGDTDKAEGIEPEAVEFKIGGSSISEAEEIYYNGEIYYKSDVIDKEFVDIPGGLEVVRYGDKVYYILADGSRIFISENKWVANEKPYCFVRYRSFDSSEYSSSEDIDLKIIGRSISEANEIYFNGEIYYKSDVIDKEFVDIPGGLIVIRYSEEVYYILVDGSRIFIALNEWVANEKPYCFVRPWLADEIEYSSSMER